MEQTTIKAVKAAGEILIKESNKPSTPFKAKTKHEILTEVDLKVI